jgi:hypothetical protein
VTVEPDDDLLHLINNEQQPGRTNAIDEQYANMEAVERTKQLAAERSGAHPKIFEQLFSVVFAMFSVFYLWFSVRDNLPHRQIYDM